MDDQTENFLTRVQADQEQAELEHRAINRVQAEALTLLKELTHNWQGGADMASDPQERKTAAIMLLWCGAVEARFNFSLFSDATAIRAQAVVTGLWNPLSLLGEAQHHLGRFLRGVVSVQADTKWDLRLTPEGERLQHELCNHPENDWLVWDHVQTRRVPAQVGIILLEGPSQTGCVAAAVAGAQANASVGNIVIQNQVDLSQLAALLRPGLGLSQVADDSHSETDAGAKDECKEQQWRDDAPEYLPLTEIRRLIDDKLSLQTLGRLCKPDGEIRYMRRKGVGCKMHISDFRRYINGRQSDPEWAAAYIHWLKGQKAGRKRLFWKCKNPACDHEYPDEAIASDICPKCKSHSELALKSAPIPGR